MPPRNPDLPPAERFGLSKARLLNELLHIDGDAGARGRVLAMETDFRTRIGQHIGRLEAKYSSFGKYNTNPFVLMFFCASKQLSRVSQLEQDLLPAKVFSSMETSAGKMIEQVVLPVYGWELVETPMQTPYSVIDGRRTEPNVLRLTTLKSGPNCLDDGMSEQIAQAIVQNCRTWMDEAQVPNVEFIYGALYGTKQQSNKKDWHILEKVCANIGDVYVKTHCRNRWDCELQIGPVRFNIAVKVGVELWNTIAGRQMAFVEVLTALVRACVVPTAATGPQQHTIPGLEAAVSLADVPANYNSALLQRSQLEWLFLLAYHFCDELTA